MCVCVMFPDTAKDSYNTGTLIIVLFSLLPRLHPIVLGLKLGQGLRPSILSKLIFSLRDMSSGPVIAVAIWILGEYCEVKNMRPSRRSTMDTGGREEGRVTRIPSVT